MSALLCYAIDSHPMDSRIRIIHGACPSITAKLAKLASDGPLMLIEVANERNEQLPDALGCAEQTDIP